MGGLKQMERKMRPVIQFVAALCLIPGVANAAKIIEGRASVIDGYTIEIHGQRIRSEGIDAPESSQFCTDDNGADYRCGQVAANWLDALLKGKVVRCEVSGTDRYRRAIADCFIDLDGQNVSVNAMMVRNGMAVAYRRYSRKYIPHEEAARSEKRGLWQGEFMMPWDWRRRE